MRAVAASEPRDRVFALSVYWLDKKVAGRRVRSEHVWVESRARLPDRLVERGALWLDGTADESVWSTLISPNGTPFSHEVISMDAPIGAVDATQYPDRSHSRNSLAPANDAEGEADRLELETLAQRHEAALAGHPGYAWLTVCLGNEHVATEGARLRAQFEAQGALARHRKKRVDANISRLWHFILHKAFLRLDAFNAASGHHEQQQRQTVLVVVQKAVETQLRTLGLPPNVAIAHFGALRGLNTYKNVPVAIVAGRPALSNIALEMLTEALNMHDPAVTEITRATEWGRATVEIDTVGGPVTLQTEAHADPHCQALASVITGGEVRQGVARIRQFDRVTGVNPCELHVFGQHAAGVSINRFASWDQASVSWSQLALSRGLLFRSPELNQKAYQGILAQEGDGGDGASGQREAWLLALTAHVAPAIAADNAGNDFRGYPYSKTRKREIDDTKNDNPGSCQPGEPHSDAAGNALAEFTLKATAEQPKPQRHVALVKATHGAALVSGLLGRAIAPLRWLTRDEGVRLLIDAVLKDASKRIAAADKMRAAGQTVDVVTAYFETCARSLRADATHWAIYASRVMGLAVPLPPVAVLAANTTTREDRWVRMNSMIASAPSLSELEADSDRHEDPLENDAPAELKAFYSAVGA